MGGRLLTEIIPKTMLMMKSLPKKIIWVFGREHSSIQKNGGNLISENLKSCEIKQLENFEGVIYNIGGTADSCIHSEPRFDKPRLFPFA